MKGEVKDSSTSPSIEFESLNPDQKKSSLNLTKFLNKFVIKPEKKIFSRFSFFRLFEVCRIWRALVERGVRAFGVVKADPVVSDPLCLKAVRNLVQIDCLLLQVPPEPFD